MVRRAQRQPQPRSFASSAVRERTPVEPRLLSTAASPASTAAAVAAAGCMRAGAAQGAARHAPVNDGMSSRRVRSTPSAAAILRSWRMALMRTSVSSLRISSRNSDTGYSESPARESVSGERAGRRRRRRGGERRAMCAGKERERRETPARETAPRARTGRHGSTETTAIQGGPAGASRESESKRACAQSCARRPRARGACSRPAPQPSATVFSRQFPRKCPGV